MLFENVQFDHIIQGIQDFSEKGYPEGFGPSTTFDLIFNEQNYPPKAVMAYANYHASSRKIENYFRGGDNTECFQVLRANGFKVEPKSKKESMINTKQEFAAWLLKSAPDSYNQYLGSSVQSVTERLNEIQEFFPEIDFFNVNENSYVLLINQILLSLKKKERIKKPKFVEYDNFHSNGIPKAVIGKNNYVKFLEEKCKNVNTAMKNSKNQELYDLKNNFLLKWPLEKLSTMKLEEYTNLDKTSFCYWLEAITTDVGSIWGGSAYKFGIFKRKDLESENYNDKRMSDGEYAWYGKYGNSKDEVFENIKNNIINTATFSQQNNLAEIDKIDLGNAYKWKIAFLYGDFNIMNIFKYDALKTSAEYLGYKGSEKNYVALNKYILSQKGDKDFFDFSKELWSNFDNSEEIVITEIKSSIMDVKEVQLNKILFGPPGTGKTYHTINEAIKIADPDFYKEHKLDRDKLKERFKLLLINADKEGNGQIAFTTFHQSFSYEDFVEGIKPTEPKEGDEYLKYEIQEGIFKKICRLANDSLKAVDIKSDSLISISEEEFDQSNFYKMSLGNSQEDDDQDIFDYCAQNNCITIGFGDNLDFTGMDEKELKNFGKEKNLAPFPIQALNLFKNYLKIGNYVVISHGNNYVRAIGKVIGDYEYLEESPFPNNPSFNHFRKVEWIFNDKEISAKDVYHKNLSQQTIYKLVKNEIKKEFFVKEKKIDTLKLPKNPKNYVIIIDEINRGNVSSIFGELITLIEKDKRAGGTEELSVILPYSKKEFKVPHNVFIVGTMNTADRSIEALDTALRRRFSFKEMPPKSYLISNESKLKESNGKIGTIDVVKILETINSRIEKLIDKDHTIGHSYFMDIKTESDLKQTFKDNVIPLLEEYFFGDFGKIGLVLGNSFISKTDKDGFEFAEFEAYDSSIKNDLMERSVFKITNKKTWNFESIYTKSN